MLLFFFPFLTVQLSDTSGWGSTLQHTRHAAAQCSAAGLEVIRMYGSQNHVVPPIAEAAAGAAAELCVLTGAIMAAIMSFSPTHCHGLRAH